MSSRLVAFGAALLLLAGCTDLPTSTQSEDADGRRDARAALAANGGITVCHIAPGSLRGRLIQVGPDAVDAHLQHGDALNLCLLITEVMYNPTVSSDFYGEYFELYNASDEPIDLRSSFLTATSLRVTDAGGGVPDYFKSLDPGNPGSYPLVIPAGGYAVVYDNGSSGSTVPFDYPIPADAVQATVDDASIGGGLNNDGDELTIWMPDAATMISRLSWDGSLANGNGFSLQRCFRGTITEAAPSPGAANGC